MVIDYSRTIHRCTQLDAYPLLRIDEIVDKLAQYRVFTTVDLKSAYHQLELNQRDREFTAFQSGNALYQLYCINALYHAYRLVWPMLYPNSNERLITLSENDLKGCYPHLDLTLTIRLLALTSLSMIAICRRFMSLFRGPISLWMNLKLNFPSLKSHSWSVRLGTGQCNSIRAGYNLYWTCRTLNKQRNWKGWLVYLRITLDGSEIIQKKSDRKTHFERQMLSNRILLPQLYNPLINPYPSLLKPMLRILL